MSAWDLTFVTRTVPIRWGVIYAAVTLDMLSMAVNSCVLVRGLVEKFLLPFKDGMSLICRH